ncbi:MAG: hypothetical protein JNL70_18250 [Saprospiraceae bacterium]|nr:hypothetical protein [Saprospiraceae bacterium]
MIRIIFALLVLTTTQIAAQSTRLNVDSKSYLFNKEKALDMRLHTHGWATNFLMGDIHSYYKTTFFRFGIGELKHHKEVRKSTEPSSNLPSQSFRQYTYGKQNFAYVLRGGYGMKRYYTEKAAKNGVALALSYSGGLTTALMVPYYIEVGGPRDAKTTSIKYSEDTKADFLDPFKVKGKSSILKGIGETKVVPGIHGQVAVHLDWGAFDEFMRAVEAGVMLDIFPKRLPIMVSEENRPYFFNLYVSLQLGKRD